MSDILLEIQEHFAIITLNRIDKHNAFDDKLLISLYEMFLELQTYQHLRLIVLKANGKHFSAGADLAWMQRMAKYSEEENIADAMILARTMNAIYQSAVPVLAVVQGSAFGGGAGLIAASDIAICNQDARFCFSEVKLGLIPSVISPYVIKAIGARQAKRLFMSAELFDAQEALRLGLIHQVISNDTFDEHISKLINQMINNAPEAVKASKQLVLEVEPKAIDEDLLRLTAQKIAKQRVSTEGQAGLGAFLNKTTAKWN